jgi:UDP-N-acetylglucosamine--N-acetylmuramyl-(pentapeptide) pyrophosphoryl-undecaprenol N-acetylglucosamine transferase
MVELQVADLPAKAQSLEALWVGGIGGMEEDLVKRAGVRYENIAAAGVHGVGIKALPGNLLQLGKGYFQARHILKQFEPDALLFTGGFVAVPMAMAGWRVPALLFVPDIEPGLALKTLATFADRIAVCADDSRRYFSRRSRVKLTGYPTRQGLSGWTRKQVHQQFNLDTELPTLLVFGGSKGAHSINTALLGVLAELLAEMQVIHISGTHDWEQVEQVTATLTDAQRQRYRPYAYLHEEMGAALRAADLVVCRSGASTLGELPLFGLPAVLVPYPYAWRYQQVNAQYLVDHGAAVVVNDADLSTRLLAQVLDLMRDADTRQRMADAMARLTHPHAAADIAREIINLVVPTDPRGYRQ